uniref:ERCC4 domain-containing protein n=1 Tax=Pavo cristatus TaxID=9049 RepID=A0A8C9EHK4_PAVCR
MRGVYLKSVRSPALGNRYKMVHREFSSTEIFSQIPEQDEAYAEDSFCVAEGDEETCKRSEWSEEEEVCINFDLLHNESFGGGRQRYLTRRRKKLHRAQLEQNCPVPAQKKPSRIIVLSDSSGEETSVSNEKAVATHGSRAEQWNAELLTSLPSVSSVPHKKPAGDIGAHQPAERSGMLLGLKASVSECLRRAVGLQQLQLGSSVKNAAGSASGPTKAPPAVPDRDAALCVLVDSREISSGTDIISSLKAVHGVKVQVCPLGSSDYVVSNRMAVERKFLSELLSSVNRSKVTQRIQRLQGMFERVCVIVEKDRTKAGETWRFLQRTQHYDGMLAALLQAGIRVLFSSCQEETAGLLKELALVEQRKNAAIRVPTEVEGHKQEMLSFYLSIPNISYLAQGSTLSSGGLAFSLSPIQDCWLYWAPSQSSPSSSLQLCAVPHTSLQAVAVNELCFRLSCCCALPFPGTPFPSSSPGLCSLRSAPWQLRLSLPCPHPHLSPHAQCPCALLQLPVRHCCWCPGQPAVRRGDVPLPALWLRHPAAA